MTLTYLNLLLGLLLLVVPAYLLYVYDRLSLRRFAASVGRMLVQMAAMGGCLWLLFRYDAVWLNLLWLLLLVVAAAFMLVSRTRLRSRVLLLPACAGMFVSVLAVSAYLLLAVLQPARPLGARWFVPLSGVLMAHVLITSIHGVRTFFDSLRQDPAAYYTLLGNGTSRLQALAPYVTRALRSLAVPAVANLSVMGLFVLPMLLSGLLLGGLSPVDAVGLYVVLVVASLAVSMLSLAAILLLACRRAFNRQGQLLEVFDD